MKFLIILLAFLFSGCMSGISIIEPKHPVGSAAPVIPIVPFEDIDADNNGTIDRLEYYEIAKEINTEDPIYGLIWILAAVIICTVVSCFLLGAKKRSVK